MSFNRETDTQIAVHLYSRNIVGKKRSNQQARDVTQWLKIDTYMFLIFKEVFKFRPQVYLFVFLA